MNMLSARDPDDDGVQVLERVEFSDDEDEDFKYEEVLEDGPEDDEDNDLADALASLQLKNNNTSTGKGGASMSGSQFLLHQSNTITQVRPSVVDDFVRNFLIKAGMKRSLEVFNTEWYELQSKGRIPSELSSAVPDIYLRNEELDLQARNLREQVDKMREVASRAQATWDKFRKERDFHRMHHKRVVQEKNKLITDLKRLRNHLRSYEPTIDEQKRRYELAMKEKMLIRLERDRLKARVKALEEQVAQLQQPPQDENANSKGRSATRAVRKQATFPPDSPGENPYNNLEFDPAKADGFRPQKTVKGHVNSVSAVAFHPKKPIFATASDDETWRLWTLPDAELVMSGEGHTSWLSSLHFHPHGSHLVTGSGDSTVKIWEFSHAKCSHTFTEHTQPVWGVEFHAAGDFVASCSMDHTVRIWDIISGKCRQTLRGHVDSVNAVTWQPYTANVCSASGDKTVSVWDGRTGLCVQTLYGHTNSCNHLCVSKRGDMIASCDADGVVKIWDIRMVSELTTIEAARFPINKVSMDRGAQRLVAACDDSTVKVISLSDFSVIATLNGHDGAVQCAEFSTNDSYMVTGGSDHAVKIWG
jgi:WD40 repeat protein/polyhydroxyalkanoate synthesis regulator phasin